MPIAIFGTVAIWSSSLILNYRHVSYSQARYLREERLDSYYRDLATHHDQEDKNRTYWLDRDLKRLAEMDVTIFSYEEKHQLPHVIAYLLTHPEVPR